MELRDHVLETLLARRRDINRFHKGERKMLPDLAQIQKLIVYFTLEVV
jgi:hypothetical protein